MADKSQQFAAVLDDQIHQAAREHARVEAHELSDTLAKYLVARGISPSTVDLPDFVASVMAARTGSLASERIAQLVATALAPASAAAPVAASGGQTGEAVNAQDAALGEHTKAKVSGFIGALVDVRDGGKPQLGQIVGDVASESVRYFNPCEDGPELLVTGSAPRPFVSSYCGELSGKLIESTDDSLAGAVRQLAQESSRTDRADQARTG